MVFPISNMYDVGKISPFTKICKTVINEIALYAQGNKGAGIGIRNP